MDDTEPGTPPEEGEAGGASQPPRRRVVPLRLAPEAEDEPARDYVSPWPDDQHTAALNWRRPGNCRTSPASRTHPLLRLTRRSLSPPLDLDLEAASPQWTPAEPAAPAAVDGAEPAVAEPKSPPDLALAAGAVAVGGVDDPAVADSVPADGEPAEATDEVDPWWSTVGAPLPEAPVEEPPPVTEGTAFTVRRRRTRPRIRGGCQGRGARPLLD